MKKHNLPASHRLRLKLAKWLIPSCYLPSEELAREIQKANCSGVPATVDINIDLETWGLTPGCAIRSIGAYATVARHTRKARPNTPGAGCYGQRADLPVMRELPGGRFYQVISRDSCQRAGLTEDPETIKWWEDLDGEAAAAFEGVLTQDLETALHTLNDWMIEIVGQHAEGLFIDQVREVNLHVWGNGATFDISILEAAMRAVGVQPAWEFWEINDCRTLERVGQMIGFNFRHTIKPETEHIAIDDAKAQGDRVSLGLQAIRSVTRIGMLLL